MGDAWGGWIEHDGAAPSFPRVLPVYVTLRVDGDGIAPAEGEEVTPSYPGFYWRWTTVRAGWFGKRKRVRVCDDPAYAPIIRYRFRRPPRETGIVAMDQLRRVVDQPRRPVVAPEGPVRQPEPAQ